MKPLFITTLIIISQLVAIQPATAEDGAKTDDPNRFNRLMDTRHQRTPALADDGVHDPENPGVKILQQPKSALIRLENGKAGNYVDWVKTLDKDVINPLVLLHDRDEKPLVMDLNIVREVKGSMPDVVFPHRQHTQWLDCTNCHPDIFIPQKGANQISMAEIILGQKCGVCHGKVAFPVTECRRCHSKSNKTIKTNQ